MLTAFLFYYITSSISVQVYKIHKIRVQCLSILRIEIRVQLCYNNNREKARNIAEREKRECRGYSIAALTRSRMEIVGTS